MHTLLQGVQQLPDTSPTQSQKTVYTHLSTTIDANCLRPMLSLPLFCRNRTRVGVCPCVLCAFSGDAPFLFPWRVGHFSFSVRNTRLAHTSSVINTHTHILGYHVNPSLSFCHLTFVDQCAWPLRVVDSPVCSFPPLLLNVGLFPFLFCLLLDIPPVLSLLFLRSGFCGWFQQGWISGCIV